MQLYRLVYTVYFEGNLSPFICSVSHSLQTQDVNTFSGPFTGHTHLSQ